MTAPSLLRIPDVAARLGVSENTVYRLIAKGSLRTVDIGIGKPRTRVRDDDLAAFIDAHTVKTARRGGAA